MDMFMSPCTLVTYKYNKYKISIYYIQPKKTHEVCFYM